MKISNIIRRRGRKREGHSYIKSLIELEREESNEQRFKNKITITSKLEKMKNKKLKVKIKKSPDDVDSPNDMEIQP